MIARRADLCEGERRKAEAIGLLAIHRERQIRRIQREFVQLLLEQAEGTSDSVSEATPADIRKNCMGAAVNHLARLRLIVPTGFAISTRPDRHACPVRVWRIIDQAKARCWLANHPDLLDPADDDQGDGKTQGVLFPIQETATPTGDAAGAAL